MDSDNSKDIEILDYGINFEFGNTYLYFNCLNCGCRFRVDMKLCKDRRYLKLNDVPIGVVRKCPKCETDVVTNDVYRFL